jgi:hypothetical protein
MDALKQGDDLRLPVDEEVSLEGEGEDVCVTVGDDVLYSALKMLFHDAGPTSSRGGCIVSEG